MLLEGWRWKDAFPTNILKRATYSLTWAKTRYWLVERETHGGAGCQQIIFYSLYKKDLPRLANYNSRKLFCFPGVREGAMSFNAGMDAECGGAGRLSKCGPPIRGLLSHPLGTLFQMHVILILRKLLACRFSPNVWTLRPPPGTMAAFIVAASPSRPSAWRAREPSAPLAGAPSAPPSAPRRPAWTARTVAWTAAGSAGLAAGAARSRRGRRESRAGAVTWRCARPKRKGRGPKQDLIVEPCSIKFFTALIRAQPQGGHGVLWVRRSRRSNLNLMISFCQRMG